ncbi:unnamed protein product [Effrenium voratum]|nr:unnamed protein product [Effrenium voratum]
MWKPRANAQLVKHLRINQELGAAPSVLKILEVCEEHLEDLDAVNVSTALHRIAKKSDSEVKDPRFGALLRRLPLLPSGGPQCLASAARASAKTKAREEPPMAAL